MRRAHRLRPRQAAAPPDAPVAAVVAPPEADPTPVPAPPHGGLDRTHDGLVSGWFTCPDCGPPPTRMPLLLVDGEPPPSVCSATPRDDVPGGRGFLMRFPRSGITGPARIRAYCPAHPDQGLDLDVPADTWAVPVLGAVESSAWPDVTGWLAWLAPGDDPALVEARGVAVPVRGIAARGDLQAYLGVDGVGAFRVDVQGLDGYAIPSGTPVRLSWRGRVLAEAEVTGSPADDGAGGCLPLPAGAAEPALPLRPRVRLRARLRREPAAAGADDWRGMLARLGVDPHGAETEQWAARLATAGLDDREVAAWLAVRATQALRVPALSPLPDGFALGDPARVPPVARRWTDGVIGSTDADADADTDTDTGIPAGSRTDAAARAPGIPPSPEGMGARAGQPEAVPDVAPLLVAGLVSHPSGLGQCARHSLAAMHAAGRHACPAGFFPGPGGWNERLGPTRRAADALAGHAVLLHVPIDRLLASVTAQPAVLATDRLIGYVLWETEGMPLQFHRGLDLVDEIWTASRFVADVCRGVTDTPVHVTGQAVDAADVAPVARSALGIAPSAFVVHYSFDANSTVARKNPGAVIDAVHRAFPDDPDAVLVLKIRNVQQAESLARGGDWHARGLLRRLEEDPRIIVVAGEQSRAHSLGLIRMADCYLSLHRAEGFGYTMAEALAVGTPVIATDYSGSTDFLHAGNAGLVGYQRIPVEPGEYFHWRPGMCWAEPDVGHAAELLTRLRSSGHVAQAQDDQTARPDLPWEPATTVAGLGRRYLELLLR